MLPQNRTPPPEPHQNYVVQSKHQPPPRATRIIRQETQTPPPPPREVWHSGPRRQINSDTEIIDRQQRMRHEESNYPETPPIRAEMYHIDAVVDNNRYSPSGSATPMLNDNHTSPPGPVYRGNGNRRAHRVEPLEQRNHNEPEQQSVRRVYKKLPPGKYEPPNDEYIPNGNPSRMVRNNDRNRPPPPQQYSSTPQLQYRSHRSPVLVQNPSNYHQSVDDY